MARYKKNMSDYDYFLAAFRHYIDKEGHGAKEYIGKNCDKTGAHIGQVYNRKTNASKGLQRQIGNFIYGSYERMLETGRALIEGREPPPEPHPEYSAAAVRQSLHGQVVGMDQIKHHDLIKRFSDQEAAYELNSMLVDIEQHDPARFREIIGYIRAMHTVAKEKAAAVSALARGKKNGNENPT